MHKVILFSSAFLLFFPPQETSNDIDIFMAKVLEKRDINWDHFYNYVFREREVLEIEGSLSAASLQGFVREYFWYVRDGYLVRSPVSVNGVRVSAEERDREERKWVRQLEKREESGRSVDRDSFFGFEFEPGNYYYAGRRQFEGREVVAVEYYPEKAFSDDDEGEDEEKDEKEEEIEEKLNKVFLITMLIDPKEHQIVRMTLDNVGFDFLPGKWLVRIGTIEASMTMHQPFDDIWLSRDINAYGKVMTAGGDLTIRYTKTFYDYAIAETKATFRLLPRGSEKQKR